MKDFSGEKKVLIMGHQKEKDKAESTRTRQKNKRGHMKSGQMTTLIFPTGG